jgi:hypothetical protein
MNERLQEELLSKLDFQYELLANDTLKLVSSTIISQPASSRAEHSVFDADIEHGLGLDQGPINDTSYATSIGVGKNLITWTFLKTLWAKIPCRRFGTYFQMK